MGFREGRSTVASAVRQSIVSRVRRSRILSNISRVDRVTGCPSTIAAETCRSPGLRLGILLRIVAEVGGLLKLFSAPSRMRPRPHHGSGGCLPFIAVQSLQSESREEPYRSCETVKPTACLLLCCEIRDREWSQYRVGRLLCTRQG